MRRFGFGEGWISRVMQCVTLVIYSVLVNGQPGHEIKPSRGIRRILFPLIHSMCRGPKFFT